MKIWLSFWAGLVAFLPHPGQAAENAMPAREETAVARTLDAFHDAASKANFEAYFSYFAPEAVFIGTDAGERWSVPVFKAYTAPHFAKGQGWTYKARERHVSFNAAKNPSVSWFDELLDSASYGTARGSGVLLKIGKEWKIAQYNLGFPIPNDLAKGMTETIKAFEARAKAKDQAAATPATDPSHSSAPAPAPAPTPSPAHAPPTETVKSAVEGEPKK